MRKLTARVSLLAAVALGCLSAIAAAQATSTQTEVKTYEVIEVNGNKVVAKGPEGTKEYNLPDDFKLEMDGKPIAVRDLKPGMKVKATITTKTTSVPVTVTEIKNGEVMVVSGTSVIVKTAEGIKQFTQEGVNARKITITKDGQEVQLAELRKGDKLTATIVTQGRPKVVTEREVSASASAAPAPAAAPAAPAPAPAVHEPAPAPAPAAAPAAPAPAAEKKLPKTASSMPLVALLGLLSVATGVGLTLARRRAAR